MTSSIYSDNGKKIEKLSIETEIQATSIKDRLLKKNFLIEDVAKKEKKEVLIALSQIRFYSKMHHQNWDLVQNIQILWHNNLKMA